MSNIMDLSKLHSNLKAEYNDIEKYWKITYIPQNISFKIDYEDINVLLSGKLFYPKTVGNNIYITCDNYFGNRINLHQIIMGSEIKKYIDIYNSKPIVFFRNRDKLDYRKSNLIVVSKRVALLNFDAKYIGVTKEQTTYRIKILNPRTNQYLIERFYSELEAAMAYDYYINLFYPNEVEFTNFGFGKYSINILYKYGIKSIQDISHPNNFANIKYPTSVNHSTGWYGTFVDEDGTIYVRAPHPITKQRITIGHTKDENELILILAKREEYLLAHPEVIAKSNVVYPPEREGKIIIAGIMTKHI